MARKKKGKSGSKGGQSTSRPQSEQQLTQPQPPAEPQQSQHRRQPQQIQQQQDQSQQPHQGQSQQPHQGQSQQSQPGEQPQQSQPGEQPQQSQPGEQPQQLQPRGQPQQSQHRGQPQQSQHRGQPQQSQRRRQKQQTQFQQKQQDQPHQSQPQQSQPPGQPQQSEPRGQPQQSQPRGQPQQSQPRGQPQQSQPRGQPQQSQPRGQPQQSQPRGQPQQSQPRGHPQQSQPRGQPQQSQPRGQPQQSQPRGQPQQSQPRGQPQQSQPRGQPQQSQPRGQPQQSQPRGQPQQSQPRGQPQQSQPRGQPQQSQPQGQPQQSQPQGQPQQSQPQGQPQQWQSRGQPQESQHRGQAQQTQLQQQQDQPQQPHLGRAQQLQSVQPPQKQAWQIPSQSEQVGHHVKDWVPLQGQGRGRGRGRREDKMKFDKPGVSGFQQGRGKNQRSSAESEISSPPVTPSQSSTALGQTLQGSTKVQLKVGEAASTMQPLTLRQPSPRPVTAAGDAPPQLLPHISGIKRRGGTNCKIRTRVLTNYFPLNIGKLETAIHYDVVIAPDRPKNLFRTIIEEFRKLRFPNRHPAYDGNKNLYSSSPLFDGSEISDSVSINNFDPNKPYEVTIKFATYVDLTCLQNYVERVSRKSVLEMEKPMQALQCLDIVLRSASGFSCIPVGRSYFTRPIEPFKLGDGCVLYNGFYQAAILGWKPFVNVDVAHKAFPSALKMVDLVRDMFGEIDRNRELLPYQYEAINRHMKQLKVEYEVNGESNTRRICRVNELGPTPKRATFTENGRTMTVEQYFKERKKSTLKHPNLPTLWVGSRTRENKILLPFELCKIVADQAVNKKMTEQQTRNMIREAATNTDKRLENIKNSVASANYNKCATVQEFGISVDANPQDVEARVLHPPTLQYKTITESVRKGVWRGTKFSEGATLSSWSILCLDHRTRDENIWKLTTDLMSQARNLGMSISEPSTSITRFAEKNLKESLRKYFSQSKCDMIIVILNNKNDCYNYVKQASEITVGCLTQCLKPATVYKLKPSTIGNILLKINAKLNGENHRINDLPMFLKRPCMIMGADVTHPGPESRDFPSVAAVTASFDISYFKYIFEWRLQPSRQEMIVDLQEITKQHLLNYYQKNSGTKPERIIYVRDGVSDGQFVQVLNVELRAIRAACQNLEHNYKPGVIFVIVQKRHHTRFFPKDPSISEDSNFNVPAGTCVDTEITHPSLIDFYLVSHASIQGVAKPTKYVKLWDDCNMSEDDIEKLMYYLCHLFARCNRSVSYPAPTYYAHLAAARARVYCEIDKIDMRNLPREQQRLTIKENISKGMPMFFV